MFLKCISPAYPVLQLREQLGGRSLAGYLGWLSGRLNRVSLQLVIATHRWDGYLVSSVFAGSGKALRSAEQAWWVSCGNAY